MFILKNVELAKKKQNKKTTQVKLVSIRFKKKPNSFVCLHANTS